MNPKKVNYKFKVFGYFIITVFIIVLIVSSLIYYNIKSVIEKETITNNNNTIIQLKNAVDIIFKQADMSLMQVAFDSSIENLAVREKQDGYQSIKYDLKRINNLLSSNFYFSSAWVYYFDSEILADVSQVDPSMIDINSSRLYNNKQLINDVINIYKNDKTKGIYNLYNLNINGEDKLTLVKPIAPYSTRPKAILIVTLNPSFFDDIMNTIKISQKSDVFIIDKDGQLISKKNKRIPVLLDCMNKQDKGKFIQKKSGWFSTQIDHKDYIISVDTSKLFGWKYIYIIPTNQIYGKINFVKKCVFIISFLCIFFGIAMSFLFTKRVYKPILKIKKHIKKYPSFYNQTNKDDIEYIDQNVEHLITKNKSLKDSLDESIPILKNSLLINIIKNNINFQEHIWDKINFYDIQLHNKGFHCVCIISIDQYESFISNYCEKQTSLFEVYQKDVITDICSSYENLKFEIINFDVNETVLILSFNESCKNNVLDIVGNIHNEIIENMKFTITIGIGCLYDSLDKIHLSYREASTAQGYKVIKGINQIIHIDDVPKYSDWEYIYPYDIENNISYYLKQRNEKELMTSLDMYFEYAKNNINATTDIKYAFIHLLDVTIKTTIQLSIDINSIISNEGNLYKQLLDKETIFDSYNWFKNLYCKIIKYINIKRENKDEIIFNNIKSYIDNNFMNSDISLDLLSQEFHFSISYLGKLYKDNENVSIKEYITQKRIENSKDLLENSNLKIKEISEKIGYVSDRSFINIFKKYVGETPGKYRDRNVKKIL